MINNRVLELLKNPKNIQSEDLHLLKEEINSFPYIQNIRALHLYGVNLYDKENYQKALSTTAAYTTDKKILYQLINGKIQQIKPEIIVEKAQTAPENSIDNPVDETPIAVSPFTENIEVAENENLSEENAVRNTPKNFSDHDYEAASEGLIADKPEIKHLVVKGERNRILFDDEENFLDEDNNETIDLESTLESGVIVTHKPVSNQSDITEQDKEDAIVAEELAGTSSEPEITETPLPETQVEEISDNAELNLEEILPESDLNKQEELTEAPKSAEIINEDQLDSKKVEEKVENESQISFQKVESFTAETEIPSEEKLNSETVSDVDKTEKISEAPKSVIIINEDQLDSKKVEEKVENKSEISFQKVESFTAETEIPSEEKLNSDTVSDIDKTEKIIEAPKSEIIINEDQLDSEKVEEKVEDESEISFQKVESFPAETAASNDEGIESQKNKTEELTEVPKSEVIINEDKIDSEKVAEKVNDDSELSFHGTDSFLPEVKIESNKTLENSFETPKSNINKHEDEMRRLIEEVEKRMRANKESAPQKADIHEEEIGHDISFAETQAFHVGEEQKVAEEVVVKEAEAIVEEKLEEEKSEVEIDEVKDEAPNVEPETGTVSTWKPMSFEASRPDSLLNKPAEVTQPEKEVQIVEEAPKSQPIAEELPVEPKVDKTAEVEESEVVSETAENQTDVEESQDQQNGEVPVMNVSFFGSDIASLGLSYKSDQKDKADAKAEEAKMAQKKIDDSNVPGFINTWQSWLKIDRVEETPVDKTEIKNKVIESFIENNPKISQLKDEVNFVVKEKTDDISHLMTETLANLYIEQKLYSKAVNAFLILANKFPDRKEYFEAKIQEIKDSRNKN
jgi:hypothetical protein